MGTLGQPEALLACTSTYDLDRCHSGLSLSKTPVRPALSVRIHVPTLMLHPCSLPESINEEDESEYTAPKSRHAAFVLPSVVPLCLPNKRFPVLLLLKCIKAGIMCLPSTCMCQVATLLPYHCVKPSVWCQCI